MESAVVSRIWWTIVVRGVLAVIFGVVALFYTGSTLLALIYLFGIFALLNGTFAIIAAVRAGERHMRWGWLAFTGIIGVLAGLVAFVWPGITALSLVFLLASWAIVSGVAEIAFALTWPGTLTHPWLEALSGVSSVLFGVLIIIWPRSGAITLTWLLGIYAIIYGAMLLYYAYQLRAVGGAVGAALGLKRTAPIR